MTQSPINWARLAPAIARALLGQPTRATRRELRYRKKGSLRVDLEKGTFADFESGRGGGMLGLIQHIRGGTASEAWQWLVHQGLVTERAARAGRSQARAKPRQTASATAPTPGASAPRQAGMPDRDTQGIALARGLWERAVDGQDTPVWAYLMDRWCWRPTDPLPAAVRWIDGTIVNKVSWNPAFPTAGGMIVAFTAADGVLNAVQIEALAADGTRPAERWRKARGRQTKTAFRIAGDDGPLRLCEGPIDALALAAAYRGPVWAAGGSGNLKKLAVQAAAMGMPVRIHSDGDGPGAKAAAVLAVRLHDRGVDCQVVRHDGMDPADWVADRVSERAAILEFDAGLSREDADRQAWEKTEWT